MHCQYVRALPFGGRFGLVVLSNASTAFAIHLPVWFAPSGPSHAAIHAQVCLADSSAFALSVVNGVMPESIVPDSAHAPPSHGEKSVL